MVLFGNNIGLISINYLTDLDGKHGFNIIGANASGAGYSVSGAGDFNGDGFDDIIIATQGFGVYILFWKAKDFKSVDLAHSFNDFVLKIKEEPLIVTGYSVGRAGDVNGDGFADIIIGSHGFHSPGKIYILFGKSTNFSNIDLTNLDARDGFNLTFPSAESIISGAGDVNGDGFDDFIINPDDGTVRVKYGNNTINANSDGFTIRIAGGISSLSAADINNDGYSDIIVGAPYSYGIIHVIYGNSSNSDLYIANDIYDSNIKNICSNERWCSITNGETSVNNFFGSSVSGAGDINGDSIDDIIVGAGRTPAAVYVILSSSMTLLSSAEFLYCPVETLLLAGITALLLEEYLY